VRPPTRPALVATVVLVVGALALVACGADQGDSESSAPVATNAGGAVPQESYPPNDYEALATIYDPMLEPMGLHLTRGALIDRSDNGYQESDEGNHLALYVEPIDDTGFTTEDYVAGLYDVTALITPYTFERWSEIDSYDICQEPPNTEDDRPEPFPETQIELDRTFGESFPWETGNLVSLLAAVDASDGAQITVSKPVRENADYKVALDEARTTASVTSVQGGSPTTG
jgi:hypothetical protein